MTLELHPVGEGCRMRLRVRAGARRDALEGVRAGALRIHVTAPAERGKANRRVVELLAEALDLAPSSVRLLSGAGKADKTVWLPLSPEAVRGALSAAMQASPRRS